MLQKVILAILLSFPRHHSDADELDRESRLETKSIAYADTVERATCTGEYRVDGCRPIYGNVTELAAAIVVQDYSESTLRRDIQAGECGLHECDSFTRKGIVYHAAKGTFQIHRNGLSLEDWSRFEGLSLDTAKASSWYFASHFAGGVGRCHALAGGFAVMSGSRACTSPRAELRARKTKALKVRIDALMRETEK